MVLVDIGITQNLKRKARFKISHLPQILKQLEAINHFLSCNDDKPLLITDTHNEIRKFIELVWAKIITAEWRKVKRNKWKNNNDVFKINYDNQLDKSFRFDKQVPNPDELQHFIEKLLK